MLAWSTTRGLAALQRLNRHLNQLVTKRLALVLQPLETSPYNLRRGFGVSYNPAGFAPSSVCIWQIKGSAIKRPRCWRLVRWRCRS